MREWKMPYGQELIRSLPAPRAFSMRTLLYAQWDRKLAAHTRFFGAAALTNMVLAKLADTCRIGISRAALDFLAAVGGVLEPVNVELAWRIERGEICVADLDRAIVVMEQSAVESLLRDLRHADGSAYARTVAQIDRLLYWVGRYFVPFRYVPGVHVYSRVLRQVGAELGRRVSFALESDRVRIGRGLIGYLRAMPESLYYSRVTTGTIRLANRLRVNERRCDEATPDRLSHLDGRSSADGQSCGCRRLA
jgi:hypothetical protein